LKTSAFCVSNSAVFRKVLTVFLLAFWLLSIYAGNLKSDHPGELRNAHAIVKPDLFSAASAIKGHEFKQKDLGATLSRVTAVCSAVSGVALQRSKHSCERSEKSHKIYEMNRAFLI
jgi:hypothetical protein